MKTSSVIACVVIVLVSVALMVKNMKIPSSLGAIDGKLASLPSTPNAVSSQTNDKERYVAPLPYKVDGKTTKAQLIKLLSGFEDTTIVSQTDTYIHAVHISKILRCRDDLEFLMVASENVVHFRSASRVGYSDMGINKQRYNQLIQRYNEM